MGRFDSIPVGPIQLGILSLERRNVDRKEELQRSFEEAARQVARELGYEDAVVRWLDQPGTMIAAHACDKRLVLSLQPEAAQRAAGADPHDRTKKLKMHVLRAFPLLKRLQIRGVGPYRAVDIGLAPRLNIFTGENGLGKTLLLDALWWVVSRSETFRKIVPRAGSSEAPSIELTIGPGNDPTAFTFQTRFNDDKRQWSVPERPEGLVCLCGRGNDHFSVWDPLRTKRHGDWTIGSFDPTERQLP
jgi:hypothetical protein